MQKSTFNARNKDTQIEIYLNSLEEKYICSAQAIRFKTGKRYHYLVELVELAEVVLKNNILTFKENNLKRKLCTAIVHNLNIAFD